LVGDDTHLLKFRQAESTVYKASVEGLYPIIDFFELFKNIHILPGLYYPGVRLSVCSSLCPSSFSDCSPSRMPPPDWSREHITPMLTTGCQNGDASTLS